MRIICYPTSGEPPNIIPAPFERQWMDRTSDGFAYRCLPLNIANAHGWMILNGAPFVAQWNGNDGLDAITINQVEQHGVKLLAASHFGHGVLTFSIHGLFRTEPGYDLWVTGPINALKDGIQPLSGVVETDWSPAPFTMNWKFTRKNTEVCFEREEPMCMIFPVARGVLETIEPEFKEMSQDENVQKGYQTWTESRLKFNADLKQPGSEATLQKWQKDYFRGVSVSGNKAPKDHLTKLKLKSFKLI